MKKRQLYLDILKIMACFGVIANHTLGYVFEYSNIGSTHIIYFILFLIIKVSVPLFIMITGILLLEKETTFKEIFNHRILRVFVPLLLISMIVFYKNSGLNLTLFLKQFLYGSIENLWQFWYLYLLIGLYLITPFLQKMIKNFETKDYQLLFIIGLLIPSVLPVLGKYFNLVINPNIILISGYIVYYIIGVYLAKITISKKQKNILICLFAGTILAGAFMLYRQYAITSKMDLFLDNINYITTVIPSLALFLIIKYYFSDKVYSDTARKIITEVSSVTFGIYLFHFIFISKIYKLGLIDCLFKFNVWIGVFTLIISIFIICGLLTYLLKKIPYVKKYL